LKSFLQKEPLLNEAVLLKDAHRLSHFVCRAQNAPLFSTYLHAILECSKTQTELGTAAANAISILVKAGASFKEADLKGIHIPGADLRKGDFRHAQLAHAELKNVRWEGAKLSNANMKKAHLIGAKFEEPFYLKVNGKATCSAYSPDGKYLAVANTKNIELYDVATNTQKALLEGHQELIWRIAISSDNRYLISGSYDKNIEVWSLETHECLKTLSGHEGRVWNVAISPDGHHIISGSADKTIKVWSLAEAKCLRTWEAHTSEVYYLQVIDHGAPIIISGGQEGNIKIWALASGELLRTLEESHAILGLSISPDKKQIISSTCGNQIKIWDIASGNCLQTLDGHTD
jgi:WD40 repeat protein